MEKRKSFLGDSAPIPRGILEILIRDVATKKVVKYCQFGNLIVNNFRIQEAHILAGDAVASRAINRVQFGTSGTPEAVTDSAITTPVTVNVTTTSYPTTKSVRFEGTLTSAQGNGVAFQECGLIFANSTLAARRAFAVMTKSVAFEWTIRWTLIWP